MDNALLAGLLALIFMGVAVFYIGEASFPLFVAVTLVCAGISHSWWSLITTPLGAELAVLLVWIFEQAPHLDPEPPPRRSAPYDTLTRRPSFIERYGRHWPGSYW